MILRRNPKELIEHLALAVLDENWQEMRELAMRMAASPQSLEEMRPTDAASPRTRALAAALAELYAERRGEPPPVWAGLVPSSGEALYLLGDSSKLPRTRRLCEEEGPLPLRRRGFYAPPDFLTFA